MLLLLATSCKKDTVIKPAGIPRSFSFTASAATPMSIDISITRPSGSMYININVIGLKNVTGLYEFNPINVQKGDKIVITVKTTKNQPITSFITVDDADVPFTGSSLNDANGVSSVTWDTVVN